MIPPRMEAEVRKHGIISSGRGSALGIVGIWILGTLSPVLLLSPVSGASGTTTAYKIRVSLDPEQQSLRAEVTLPVPDSGTFKLHAGLEPQIDGGTLTRIATDNSGRVPTEEFRVHLDSDDSNRSPGAMTIRYAGVIHHPVESSSREYARSFSGSPGLISAEGVVLSQSAAWLPSFGEALVEFELEVELPATWTALSQGSLIHDETVQERRTVRWSCPHPMDDVYLIAAAFHVERRAAGAVEAMTYLRRPDRALADRYLTATAQYLDLYQRLLGPYPYSKFALVENFWETGYGMPSFTLLGPRIIRFPFILHSSYPHEILHNWWGNSVFVDWETGNWCEGLTAYLADHLIKEGRGQGTQYRRDSLSKYRSYVRGAKDFPLREFRSRHSASTEAVGYGKSLMLFHMLRRDLGDPEFARGLQRFYRKHRFTRASFDDLAQVFSEVAERDLVPFFSQWVDRTGAPALALTVTPSEAGSRASLEIRQTQAEAPYALKVPIAIHRDGSSAAEWRVVDLNESSVQVDLTDFAKVNRIEVDPNFDLFRRLDAAETPPTLSRLFGADRVVMVLPSEVSATASDSDDSPSKPVGSEAWKKFAEAWAKEPGVRVVDAAQFEEIPENEAVWILGANNSAIQHAKSILARRAGSLENTDDQKGNVDLSRRHAPAGEGCGVVVLDHPHRPELAIGWLYASDENALPGLARKLPHYGKYSYLAFSGAEPTNFNKGQWPITGSPLEWVRSGAPKALSLGTREALAVPRPVFDERVLKAHVEHLASDAMEGRGVGTQGLEQAANYIAEQFRTAGLEPLGDTKSSARSDYFEHFVLPRDPDGKPAILKNIVGVIPGSDPAWADQCVVIGAHYDHLGRGWPDVRSGHENKIHNGADDNASGVSVLLEVAKKLAKSEPRRSLVFVAFSGEEAGRHGSKHFAGRDHGPYHRDRVLCMINLDGVGRLEGRALQILGAGTAYEWPHIARGIGFTTGVDSKSIANDPGGSDQVSFHEVGIPAIHLFGGLHEDYHRSTDDADKIDGAGLVKVAVWLEEAVGYLSAREEPFKSQLGSGSPAAGREPASDGSQAPSTSRRVLLGTEPEFSFAGPGVKVAGITPNSPAAAAGIQAGDLLIAIDGHALTDLRGYSNRLRQYQPGDTVTVRLKRGDETLEVKTTLKAR